MDKQIVVYSYETCSGIKMNCLYLLTIWMNLKTIMQNQRSQAKNRQTNKRKSLPPKPSAYYMTPFA